MGWPQIVIIVLFTANLVIGIMDHGKPRSNSNGWVSLVDITLYTLILCAGGFFK